MSGPLRVRNSLYGDHVTCKQSDKGMSLHYFYFYYYIIYYGFNRTILRKFSRDVTRLRTLDVQLYDDDLFYRQYRAEAILLNEPLRPLAHCLEQNVPPPLAPLALWPHRSQRSAGSRRAPCARPRGDGGPRFASRCVFERGQVQREQPRPGGVHRGGMCPIGANGSCAGMRAEEAENEISVRVRMGAVERPRVTPFAYALHHRRASAPAVGLVAREAMQSVKLGVEWQVGREVAAGRVRERAGHVRHLVVVKV